MNFSFQGLEYGETDQMGVGLSWELPAISGDGRAVGS